MLMLCRQFRSQERGAVVVEFAFYSIIVTVLIVGVIDFGLAYSRQMAMSNAVRAGTQFALARRPSIGPNADAEAAIVSLQDIRNAVVTATPFIETDPGPDHLDVAVVCECEDGSSTPCVSQDDVPLACTVRIARLVVSFSMPYDLILPIFGFGSQLTISSNHVLRLT